MVAPFWRSNVGASSDRSLARTIALSDEHADACRVRARRVITQEAPAEVDSGVTAPLLQQRLDAHHARLLREQEPRKLLLVVVDAPDRAVGIAPRHGRAGLVERSDLGGERRGA